MTTTFTGNVGFSLRASLNKALNLGSAPLSVPYNQQYVIANGVSAHQDNMFWADTRTLTASSSDSLDLFGGIINSFGDTINFTQINGIFIFANSLNTNNLIIGNGTNPFVNWVGAGTHTITVKPGGMFALYDPSAAGYAVTNTTADTLKITNSSSGTSVTYDIMLIGVM